MMHENPQEPETVQQPRRAPVWGIVFALLLLAGFLVFIGASLVKKSSPPVKLGDTMPEFALTSFDGQSYSSGELAGKVVLINFWASWCATCADEAAALQTAWSEYEPGGKVIFLGVDYSDTEPEAKAYIQYFGLNYPSGTDLGTRISQLFRITGVPETYIFDANGRLVSITIGPFKTVQEIRSAVNGALE
jgi:Thiol-disulfide isomerase and thioredoxins